MPTKLRKLAQGGGDYAFAAHGQRVRVANHGYVPFKGGRWVAQVAGAEKGVFATRRAAVRHGQLLAHHQLAARTLALYLSVGALAVLAVGAAALDLPAVAYAALGLAGLLSVPALKGGGRWTT